MATNKAWEGNLRGANNGARKKDKQNISVYVRCRPFSEEEKRTGVAKVVTCNHTDVELKERATGSSGQHLTKKFSFDRVFSPAADQIEVYQEVVAPVVKEALQGYNCTVFAYGQTGTGKTFTMEGERSETSYSWDADPLSGIIPRCIHQIFDTLESTGTEFAVRVSYLELYNEELFDLLSNSDNVESGMRLKLFEGNDKALVIQNLSENSVRTKHEVYKVLAKGTAKRKTAETQMNAHSSRSHSIFIVTIHMKEYNVNGEEELIKTAKLNLVDLAGSENIGRSGAKGVRATEAGNINQSLLTLGRVITALVDRTPHVPYRESKLTRLLQDSLGGRTKTTIVATISPGVNNMEETLSTLDYAHRAKNITNKPEVNQKLTKKALIKQYEDEIEQLKRDLAATRDKNGFFMDLENYEKMKNQIEMNSEIVKQLEETIEAKEQSKAHYESLFLSTSTKLDKTTEKLQATRTALSEVHEKLKTNRRERDAKAAIVGELEKTESRLVAELRHMINIADEEKENLEAVHDKLDRQRMVDQKNEATIANHVTTFASGVDGIRASISVHSNSLADASLAHLAAVKEVSENQVNDFENSKAVLASLSNQLNSVFSRKGKEENNVPLSLKEATATAEEGTKSLETYVDSAMTKYFLNTLTDVSTRLSEQQRQIETLLSEATASAINILDKSAKFEETHLQKLKEIEEMAESQCQERQKTTLSTHSDLQNIQAQIAKTLSALMKSKEDDESQTKVLRLKVDDASNGFSEDVSKHRSCVEDFKAQISSNSSSVESTRAAIESSVNQLPANVETVKTEYAAKSKRRFKEVSKAVSATIDVVEDVNAQAQEVLKSQVDAFDQQTKSQQQWTTTFSAAIEDEQKKSEEQLKQIDGHLARLVQDENVFVTEEISKNVPTGQTPKRRTFKFGGHDSILRTRDPNVIVEEFEENYQLSESILQPFDADDLDNSISSDASAATADSGRPGSRAASRDPVGVSRAALKPVN